MGAAGDERDRVDDPGGQDDGAGARLQGADDLLDGDQDAPGGECRLLLHPGQAPQLDVAGPVGLLRVDDGDIRVEGGDGGQFLAGERADDGGDRGRTGRDVAAAVAAEHREREPGRARGVAVGHPGVTVLVDLQRGGPAVLDGVPEAVQRTDARVAAPGEDQLPGRTRADQLVVDDVGGHPGEREVLDPLTDDLVRGGERDEVGEPLQRHGVAVMNQLRDGLVQGTDVGHVLALGSSRGLASRAAPQQVVRTVNLSS